MTEQQARVLADAKDWYLGYYIPVMGVLEQSKYEHSLGEAVAMLIITEKTLPPGIKVIRETPTGPVLDEPYVVQKTPPRSGVVTLSAVAGADGGAGGVGGPVTFTCYSCGIRVTKDEDSVCDVCEEDNDMLRAEYRYG